MEITPLSEAGRVWADKSARESKQPARSSKDVATTIRKIIRGLVRMNFYDTCLAQYRATNRADVFRCRLTPPSNAGVPAGSFRLLALNEIKLVVDRDVERATSLILRPRRLRASNLLSWPLQKAQSGSTRLTNLQQQFLSLEAIKPNPHMLKFPREQKENLSGEKN